MDEMINVIQGIVQTNPEYHKLPLVLKGHKGLSES